MEQNNNSFLKTWHVIYTRSRSEKKVSKELTSKHIECFLPLQKKLRQWKDRKKWVETPLLPGYCFVHITPKEYDKVLQTKNVVCYVRFEGKAAIIPDNQIDALKKMLQQFDFDITVSNENFEAGKKVKVIGGPLAGLQGELIGVRGKNKFILRFEQINNSFLVEVPAQMLTSLPEE